MTTILTNTDLIATDALYSTEEFSNFGIGVPISMNVNLLSKDSGNTFFDISNNPKVLQFWEIPTILNNQWYFNRDKIINCYDAINPINWQINLVGKLGIRWGDSLGGAWWVYHLPFKTGIIWDNTPVVADGGRAEQVLEAIQSQVAIDATYVSRQEFIFIYCSTHDYNQGKTVEQFTSDYQDLIDYIRSENALTPIISISMHSAKTYSFNPTGDPNIPNTGGMTLENTRTIIQSIIEADTNGYYLGGDALGLIYPDDYPDGIHTYTHSGAQKTVNGIMNILTTINNTL